MNGEFKLFYKGDFVEEFLITPRGNILIKGIFEELNEEDGAILIKSSGVIDCKGSLIFAGDICLFPTGDKKEIIFNKGSFGYFALGDFIPLQRYKDINKIEKIGSIYQKKRNNGLQKLGGKPEKEIAHMSPNVGA